MEGRQVSFQVGHRATEPRYLLSRGLLPSPAALSGCGGKTLLESDMGPSGPIHAGELPPSLPVSSSISRPFSREPQALGFLERPQISKLASSEERTPRALLLWSTCPLSHTTTATTATEPFPPFPAPSPCAGWRAMGC